MTMTCACGASRDAYRVPIAPAPTTAIFWDSVNGRSSAPIGETSPRGPRAYQAAQGEAHRPRLQSRSRSSEGRGMISDDFLIEDERFAELALGNVRLERLYSGTRFGEGPAYFPAGKFLLWSDIPNDRILRFDETDDSVSVFEHKCGYHNGHTVDLEGRLISCEHGARCVSRIEHDGTRTMIAERFAGGRLNSPNDVVVRSDGSIWFTDPTYGIDHAYEGNGPEPSQQDGSFVFRIDGATGELAAVARDFVQPNGLAFSRDES